METNTNLSLFPNPPKHYKLFTKEDSLPYPDLNFLNKMNSFMSFGKEYKTKEINYFSNTIDSGFLRHYDPVLLESKNIPNSFIFQNTNFPIYSLNVDNLNVNIIEAIESEIKFIRKTYLELLNQINENIDECELSNCLIKFSFQKIYFFISLLKRKQVKYI
jgi:hypothetical protein